MMAVGCIRTANYDSFMAIVVVCNDVHGLYLMATFHYTIQVADQVCDQVADRDLVVDLLARTSSLLAS